MTATNYPHIHVYYMYLLVEKLSNDELTFLLCGIKRSNVSLISRNPLFVVVPIVSKHSVQPRYGSYNDLFNLVDSHQLQGIFYRYCH